MIDTKLKRLEAATEKMDWDTRERFDNCLIGALSMLVSNETWDKAISAASRCVASMVASAEHPSSL